MECLHSVTMPATSASKDVSVNPESSDASSKQQESCLEALVCHRQARVHGQDHTEEIKNDGGVTQHHQFYANDVRLGYGDSFLACRTGVTESYGKAPTTGIFRCSPSDEQALLDKALRDDLESEIEGILRRRSAMQP